MFNLKIAFLFILILFSFIFAWRKHYTGDQGKFIFLTGDGGYIVTGCIEMTGNGGDVSLTKLSKTGEIEWEQNFGGDKFDIGECVIQTLDGGYIVCGAKDCYHDEFDKSDIYIIKTDAKGIKYWEKTYGAIHENDYGLRIRQIVDGSYILCGLLNGNAFLMKTNVNGEHEWSKSYGGEKFEIARDFNFTKDGGFIIVGQTNSYGAGVNDILLVKADKDGNQQWYKTFGGIKNEVAEGVIVTQDGGYIICGGNSSISSNDKSDMYVIKTDQNGNEMWSKNYGSEDDDFGMSMLENDDGTYILGGYSKSNQNKGFIYYLGKSGEVQSSKVLDFCVYNIRKNHNNEGIILLGSNNGIITIMTLQDKEK